MDKVYHIKLNGELIPVTVEVYRAYMKPKWREKKQDKVRLEKESSYDLMVENGFDMSVDTELWDEIIADKLLMDELHKALAELTYDESSLINDLYYQDLTVRDCATKRNISHVAVIKRHKRLLAKLRKKFEKFFK